MEINATMQGESNHTDGNGGDWFTVAPKRRRDTSLPTTTTAESKPDRTRNQAHGRKPRLPPLPPSGYKIITALQHGGKEYQVYAYVASPDMSCKGVATGIDSETHSDELMANLRSPQAPILFARMLGKSTAALIAFDKLEVPRTIYYYGGELLCRPYRPLSQVFSICLKTGHRADICSTAESAQCENYGHENPSENNQCQPKCVLCGGDHPVTDSSCPARQRKPFNKSHFLRNAGYTSDANNIPTTTNPGTSTNQPQTPGSKLPPASTETNVDKGRSHRRSADSKKRNKSRDTSTSRSQSLPRAKTPRHERHEAAANDQMAESRSTNDMLEKSECKAVTKGPSWYESTNGELGRAAFKLFPLNFSHCYQFSTPYSMHTQYSCRAGAFHK
ncbi:hypothetical protein HPB49_003408 [Dermacentor silvarum]|uniref:Uncharacterized protein n=1 Tax=Dermacentor silvarum TaxID=543639 RepID=A0ACB8C757_DERSI|nr:hypothetical protein HPB49_003408 [Dermacentor silvarum]